MFRRVVDILLAITFLICCIGVNVYAVAEDTVIKGKLVYKLKDNSLFKSEYKLPNFSLSLHYFVNEQEITVSLTTDNNGNFTYAVPEGNVSKAFFVVKAENEACYVVPNTDGDGETNLKNVYTFDPKYYCNSGYKLWK